MEIIREAQREDIPRLVELGEEFARLSQPAHGISVSRERIIEFTNDVVDNTLCVFLVLEVDEIIQGVILGLVSRVFFSEDVALQELVWYVKKGYSGLQMLKAFEYAAAGRGCTKIIIGNKPAYCDLQRVYERIGFKVLEQQYIKNI